MIEDEGKLRSCVAAAMHCFVLSVQELSGEKVDIKDISIEPACIVEMVEEELGKLDYFDLEIIKDQYNAIKGDGAWEWWKDQII